MNLKKTALSREGSLPTRPYKVSKARGRSPRALACSFKMSDLTIARKV